MSRADALGGGRGERVERHAGKSSRSRPSCRYSGRKSCPHWLMQCASSMAMNRRSACCSSRRSDWLAVADQPLGRHVEQPAAVRRARSRAPRRARAAAACCSGTTPRRRRRAGRRPDPSSARSAATRRARAPAPSRRRDDAPAPESRATCRRRSAGRRRCRARRGWRASPRAAADGSRRSPRRGGARRAAASGDRVSARWRSRVLDVVIDEALKFRRELVVGAAQRRRRAGRR